MDSKTSAERVFIMIKDSKKENNQIVFLGESGFPIGLAAIERITLMAKALVYAGCNVTVVCRKGVWRNGEGSNVGIEGNFEGIDYIYTSKYTSRQESFLRRNWDKLKGLYMEFKYLKYLKKNDKLHLAIITNMSILHILRYRIYSAYLNFPIVLNLVEMTSSMQGRTDLLTRVNDYFLDNWIIKLFHGALPISDRLMDYYQLVAPSRSSLKLPILCDFDKFDKLKRDNQETYFLYCGSIAYMEVIKFVIDVYNGISKNLSVKLYMIISGGGKNSIEQLQEDINSMSNGKSIRIFSDIPYEELVDLYNHAVALLIPLRPTLQDTSRFPHKIGEYLASGNPVVTTDVGEIRNYFDDGLNALIAKSYSQVHFAEKMKYILNQPDLSKEIGLKGKNLGRKEFDYRNHGLRLRNFLKAI